MLPQHKTHTQTNCIFNKKKKRKKYIQKTQNYDIVYGKKNKIGVYMCLFEII